MDGYCPTPEAKFRKAPLSMVLKLEELLHYFHVCCKDAVAALGSSFKQDAFLANVDVCAAEAFVTASEKFTLLEMQNHLLTATQTYHDQLAAVAEQSMPQTLDKMWRGWFSNVPKRKRINHPQWRNPGCCRSSLHLTRAQAVH